jgi:hypothetical protein
MHYPVEFDCPHCGHHLEADTRYDGVTLPCPNCNGLVTLQLTAGTVITATILSAGIAILGSLFDN